MPLQDEISAKFSDYTNKELIDYARGFYKKLPATADTLRDAFIYSVAALLHDKEQMLDDKPLLIHILGALTKLCSLVKNNKEYKEQYALYMIMSLANYSEYFNHELVPLDLFKQIPNKSLQLHILAQPKLPADWTLAEIKELLNDLAKNIQSKEINPSSLARINLAMRYSRAGQTENCKEQLAILAQSPEINNTAKDLIDYLKIESTPAEAQEIAVVLNSTKQLTTLYQHCIFRAMRYFQLDRTQEESDFFTLLITAGDITLKDRLNKSTASLSISEITSEEKPAIAVPAAVKIPGPPTRMPPPVPTAKGNVPAPPPPPRGKPKETKAKTMSRKAGADVLKALRQHSGYEEKSPLAKQSKKEAAAPKQEEEVDLLKILARAMDTRRTSLENEDADDESSDRSWSSDDEQPTSPKTNKSDKSVASRPLPVPIQPVAAPPPLTREKTGSRPSVLTLFGSPPKEAAPQAKSPPTGATSPTTVKVISQPKTPGKKS